MHGRVQRTGLREWLMRKMLSGSTRGVPDRGHDIACVRRVEDHRRVVLDRQVVPAPQRVVAVVARVQDRTGRGGGSQRGHSALLRVLVRRRPARPAMYPPSRPWVAGTTTNRASTDNVGVMERREIEIFLTLAEELHHLLRAPNPHLRAFRRHGPAHRVVPHLAHQRRIRAGASLRPSHLGHRRAVNATTHPDRATSANQRSPGRDCGPVVVRAASRFAQNKGPPSVASYRCTAASMMAIP